MNYTGENKQSYEMEGQQNETRMTMCCHGDVVLFKKNRIHLMKLFCDYYFMHIAVKCSFLLIFSCKLKS